MHLQSVDYWLQCHTPADTSDSSLPVPLYGLSVTKLQKESKDKCTDQQLCSPLRTTSPSAPVEDGTCSVFIY